MSKRKDSELWAEVAEGFERLAATAPIYGKDGDQDRKQAALARKFAAEAAKREGGAR